MEGIKDNIPFWNNSFMKVGRTRKQKSSYVCDKNHVIMACRQRVLGKLNNMEAITEYN